MADFPDFPKERRRLHELLQTALPEHQGQHVVIIEDEVLGFFDDLDAALDAGFARRGSMNFFSAELTSEPKILMLPFIVRQ